MDDLLEYELRAIRKEVSEIGRVVLVATVLVVSWTYLIFTPDEETVTSECQTRAWTAQVPDHQLSAFMNVCMRGQGWEPRSSDKCIPGDALSAINSACYEKRTPVFKIERWLRNLMK